MCHWDGLQTRVHYVPHKIQLGFPVFPLMRLKDGIHFRLLHQSGYQGCESAYYIPPGCGAQKKYLKEDQIKDWIVKGAKPSDSVHNLLVSNKVINEAKRSVKLPAKEVEEKTEEKEAKVEEEKKEAVVEEKVEEEKK